MAVIATDDLTFQDELKKNSKVVVKYFADWCGTCKLFAPKYKRLSSDERFKDIVFLEVDAEKNPDARKLGTVKNLPTFAIFKDGELIDSLCASKEEAVLDLLQKIK